MIASTPVLEEKLLKKDGYVIHYFAAGRLENELIVFLHPAFGDHHCFYRQIDFFAERYHILTVDLLGHGLSQAGTSGATLEVMAGHIAEIMALEGHATGHIVGVSMGSLVAQDVAAKFPEKIKSLTVVGGYSIFGDNREIQRAQTGEMIKWLFLIAFSMQRFRRYVTANTVIHQAERDVLYHSAQHFTRGSLRVLSGMQKIMRPGAQSAQPPLLIVIGDHDLKPIEQAAKTWRQTAANSEFHVIPDAGHCANMDNSAEFNRRLLTFIEAHAAPVP
jgi:3-oxoadipate enol-lactonase